MHPMLNIAVRAARTAGNIISLKFEDHKNITVEEKAKNDLVTNIDSECERAITDILLKSFPNHCVRGEEFGVVGNQESDHVWIIDPIDGTTNFYKGIPHVAVSIGLRVKDVTTVGVVYDPIRNELFTASRGDGAQLNGKRIRAGVLKGLDSSILATSFPHRDRQYLSFYKNVLNSVFDKCADIRRAGTASLDLAYVAAGRLDGYFELCLKPWDFCAGELLCREAGAVVTNWQGGPDIYKNGCIVCGNSYIVPALLRAIKENEYPVSLA
ncbi:MAG: inositol-1-monophosphatase [Succinivibrionaceae bacterium]